MPWGGPGRVARRPGGRGARHTLRPCDLSPATRLGAPGPAASPPPVWLTLSHRRSDAPGHRRGPDASRGGDWRLRRAPHLGPATAPSSPSPLCPACRGDGTLWHTVGIMSSPFLLARSGPLAAFSAPVPRGAGAPLWAGPPDLDGALSGAGRAHTLAASPRRAA